MTGPSNIKKILLISLSNLGDIILSTPVLTRLHKEFTGAKIDIIAGAPAEDVFKGHPAVNKMILRYRRPGFLERVQQISALRKEKYDLVVDLKNSMLPFILGARSRSSFAAGQGVQHKKMEHLSKIRNIVSGDLDGSGFYLPEDPDGLSRIDGVDAGGPKRVVVNPGAKSHLKRWPARNFAELSDRIIKDTGARVFITGASEDKRTVSEMIDLMEEKPVDLCSRTSLGVLAALMRRSHLVVTNDSAPLHVASAVNAPTIAIFGPTDEKKYGPLSDRHKVFTPGVKCRPCEKALCAEGPDPGCIPRVGVDEVFTEAKKMLEGDRPF